MQEKLENVFASPKIRQIPRSNVQLWPKNLTNFDPPNKKLHNQLIINNNINSKKNNTRILPANAQVPKRPLHVVNGSMGSCSLPSAPIIASSRPSLKLLT